MPENPFDDALEMADERAASAPIPQTIDAPDSGDVGFTPRDDSTGGGKLGTAAIPEPEAKGPKGGLSNDDLAAAGITMPESTPAAKQAPRGITGGFTAREHGIKNPVLRTLAEIGDVAGSAFFPGIVSAIPGTRLNEERAQARQLGIDKEQAGIDSTHQQDELRKAQAEEATARAEEIRNPHAKAQTFNTPEEATLHDLMTGENGQPRINPQTNKPYTYLEAFSAVKQSAQDVKPDKAVPFEEANYQEWLKSHPNGTRMQFEKDKADATRKPEGEVGSWQLAEGEHGEPVLFNSKTGETKAAPANLHAKGTMAAQQKEYQKNIAPLESAMAFADNYLASGKYTGSDDDTLMLQYFELAKPESGFRLNTAEIKRQNQARSWRDSAEAFARHATTGVWFSDDQRKQIVESMHHIGDAKKLARQGGPGGQGAAHENEPQRPANVPQDYVFKENGPKGRGWYKPKAQ